MEWRTRFLLILTQKEIISVLRISKLIERHAKCIRVKGKYVEKENNCEFYFICFSFNNPPPPPSYVPRRWYSSKYYGKMIIIVVRPSLTSIIEYGTNSKFDGIIILREETCFWLNSVIKIIASTTFEMIAS